MFSFCKAPTCLDPDSRPLVAGAAACAPRLSLPAINAASPPTRGLTANRPPAAGASTEGPRPARPAPKNQPLNFLLVRPEISD